MNNIVRFSIGCMGLIMLTFVVVMYFGFSGTSKVTTPEGQTQQQVQSWMDKNLDKEHEIVRMSKECIFEGEERRYRVVELRAKEKASSAPAAVERYVIQSKPNGVVVYHWRLDEFISEKMNAAKTESTPERVAWYEKRWRTLLKEMDVDDQTISQASKPATPAAAATGAITTTPTPSAPNAPAR
jgi:cytoskeletal protein RodZ